MSEQLMQAAWYEKQGAAKEVIHYQEMPIPQPGAGESASQNPRFGCESIGYKIPWWLGWNRTEI